MRAHTHTHTSSPQQTGHDILAMFEDVIFWFLWCLEFIWKAEFDVSPNDDTEVQSL